MKRALLLLPWVVVAVLGAELGMALFIGYRESHNPYLSATNQELDWPNAGSGSALLEDAPAASDVILPGATREQAAVAHAAYLVHQDERGLQEYTQVMLRQVAAGEGDAPPAPVGNSREFRPPPREVWEAALRPVDTPGLPTGVSALAASVQQDGREWTAVRLLGEGGARHVLLHDLPFDAPPETSPYLRPFLSFKPHGQPAPGTTHFGVPAFRLNNFGFRGDDIAVPRPAEVFRVVCIGASTTMEGAVDGFTYPALVQRFLRERFPGRNIEVVNCGVAGINSIGERARTADYLMLDPNVAVVYDGVNDICHRFFTLWRFELSMPLGALQRSRVASALLAHAFLPTREKMAEDFRRGAHENFFAIAEHARRCGVETVLCTFAHPDGDSLNADERVYFNWDARMHWTGIGYGLDSYLTAIAVWNDILREDCAKRGVRLIDVAAQIKGGGRVFGDICHMKDYGIEQKARVIAAGLEPLVAQYYASR